jgi:anti-sigma B factor antagonist
MSITTRRQGDTAIVAIDGAIDISNVGQMDDQVTAAVQSADTNSVLVDLSGLTFMDSSGISSLLKGRRQADAVGTQYQVAGAEGVVRQVLDLTGVWTYLSRPMSEDD